MWFVQVQRIVSKGGYFATPTAILLYREVYFLLGLAYVFIAAVAVSYFIAVYDGGYRTASAARYKWQ